MTTVGGVEVAGLTDAEVAARIALLVTAVWVLAVVARPYQWWRVAGWPARRLSR